MLQLAGEQCSVEWYQALFNANSQPMCFFDQETLVFLDVNQAAINCYGYTREEFLDMTIRELRLPEDVQILIERMPQVLAGPFHQKDTRHRKRDGGTLYVELTTHPLHYAGRPAILVTANNVTGHKQIEEKLENLSRQYESLFFHHPDLVFSLDLDGRFLSINPAGLAMGGYSALEVIGQPYLELVTPDDREKAHQYFLSAVAGQTNRFEVRGVHQDGHLLWLDIINLPIVVDRKIVGVYGISRDVTGQRMAEAALRKITEELLRALDAASILMWEWDTLLDQVVTFGDPYPIYGHRETNAWTPTDYARQCPKEDRIRVVAEVDRALRQKTAYDLECRVIWPDGSTHWMEVRGHAFPDAEEHLCVSGMFMDITRRKQAEEALSRAHAELEQKVADRTAELQQANQELKKLSAYLQAAREEERTRIAREIHDELGGILTAIKYDLTTGHQQGDEDTEVIRRRDPQSIDLVDSAIASLRRIITDLRPSVLDDMGLWAALEWLATECANRMGIPCQYDMKGPEEEVSADLSVAVFRIVQELLTNIARHSKATQIRMEVGISDNDIFLRIHDNGIGITKERLLASKSFGILGIQERVRFFNGSIKFQGRPNKGTTVSLQFPLHQS